MRVDINIPEIASLRSAVEQKFGCPMRAPRHFTSLSFDIEEVLHEYLSETTLQRLWLYKSGYRTVAIHSLNVLSRYVGHTDWEAYCSQLRDNSKVESVLFDGSGISIKDLKPGSRIRIGWQPDRVCVIEYLGEFRFRAVETHNAKLSAGDTFNCTRIQIGHEMCLDNLVRGESDMNYVIGTSNGLTMLEVLD